MKKEKKLAKDRLMELNEVQFYKPTVMELHAQRNHLVRRVQRMEDVRYRKKIEAQREKLKKYLKNIEKYESALKENDKKAKLVKPKISIGSFPVRVRTRIEKRRRLKPVR